MRECCSHNNISFLAWFPGNKSNEKLCCTLHTMGGSTVLHGGLGILLHRRSQKGEGGSKWVLYKIFWALIGTLYWQEWLLGPPRGQHGSTWTFGTSYMLVSHTKINFSISATKSMYKKKGFIQDCLIHCSIFMKEYRSVQIDKYIVKIYQIRSIDSFQPTQF